MGPAYYAVAIGRSSGIYSSWSEVEPFVKGYPNARYKKFRERDAAESFLQMHQPKLKRKHSDLELDASSKEAPATKKTNRQSPPQTFTKNISIDSKGIHKTIPEITSAPSALQQEKPDTPTTYYVVARGEKTGIFRTWKEVHPLIQHYHGPIFRKFPTETQAQEFFQKYQDKQRATPDREAKYYAVAKGRATGVFENWDDVLPLIQDLHSAVYKKFPTYEEAERYVRQYEELRARQVSDPDPKHPDTLVAFCDGSSVNNGRRNCKAAYACVFPHNESWNVVSEINSGLRSNNRAEYLGALEAMKRANLEDPSQQQPLYIFTDSNLLIRSLTEWIIPWKVLQAFFGFIWIAPPPLP